MYQCSSFYTADRILPDNQNIVVAAWAVTADQNYSFDMREDTLIRPKMYCFIRTTDGKGIIRTSRGEIMLERNNYIVIPRKDILEYHSKCKIWSYYWVDFIVTDVNQSRVWRRMYAEYSTYEQELFQELLDVGQKYPHEIRYINCIFSHYFFFLCFKNDGRNVQSNQSVQFSEICAYIDQKLYSRISIQELADFFSVSPRRIHQIFEKNAGLPPKQYISKLKIEKSKQLLAHTSLSIVDIAEALGYDSPYHFSTVFRKKEGTSPSSYRNAVKKADEAH